MLTPRLTNAVAYQTIPYLMSVIDNTLANIANDLYNNTIYSLHRNIECGPMQDLLLYKRILLYKSCNVDYCPDYTVEQIAGRVITLTSAITAPQINITYPTTTTTTTLGCGLAGTATKVWELDCELCGTAINLSENPSYC
jgi:hypothetical protein